MTTKTKQGTKKCKTKKNFNVAPETVKPLQIQTTKVGPQIGITLKRLVITTEAQKLIWAQTKTQPIKASIITNKKIVKPEAQTNFKR